MKKPGYPPRRSSEEELAISDVHTYSRVGNTHWRSSTSSGFRTFARVALIAFVGAIAMWSAPPADAGCTFDKVFGWSQPNHTLYGDSVIVCNPELATYNEIKIQEKVLFAWATRASDIFAGPPTYGDFSYVYYTCSGHGTRPLARPNVQHMDYRRQ